MCAAWPFIRSNQALITSTVSPAEKTPGNGPRRLQARTDVPGCACLSTWIDGCERTTCDARGSVGSANQFKLAPVRPRWRCVSIYIPWLEPRWSHTLLISWSMRKSRKGFLGELSNLSDVVVGFTSGPHVVLSSERSRVCLWPPVRLLVFCTHENLESDVNWMKDILQKSEKHSCQWMYLYSRVSRADLFMETTTNCPWCCSASQGLCRVSFLSRFYVFRIMARWRGRVGSLAANLGGLLIL